jgi:rRNA maturation endonuclease Nob1
MDKEKTLRKLKQEIEEVREKFGVEFAEVVHGRWIRQDDTFTRFRCSACSTVNHRVRWQFCPACGADMRERRDDNVDM